MYIMWQLWVQICHWYNRKISQFFAWLGETVSNHPLLTIVLGFVLLGVLASGLAFMKIENRTERLYVPQNSESVQNLEKAQEYGFYHPARLAEILIFQKDENVLKKECFIDALDLHKLVVAIPGYHDVCLPNLKNDPEATISFCKAEEPLWIFNYTSNFDNLLSRLNSHLPTYASLFQIVFGSKATYNENGEITSSQGIRMVYYIKGVGIDEDVPEDINDWERKFLKQMKEFHPSLNCEFVYNAERGLDDAILETTVLDVKFIALTYALMISFSCFMLGKYRNLLIGHALLAVSGIHCVVFGILAGFGLTMFTQTSFVSIAGLIPFVILGVGIDDMFIIIDELDRTHPNQPVSKRVSAVMRTVGPAITMTTLTDVLAFAVGTTSKFPAVVYFCTYAALSITLAFIFLVTIFLAFMSYDCRRMNAGRRDILPCLKTPLQRPGAPRWDESLPQTSNKVMEAWGRFLMKPVTKVFVVIMSISLLAVGIYGTTFVNENFDRRQIAKDGSEYIKFIDAAEEYFKTDTPVDLILGPGVNYSDPVTQQKINDLTQIVAENKFYRPYVSSWFSQLQIWYKSQNTRKTLLGCLDSFLNSHPQFRKDILYSENNSTIMASRFHCFLRMTSSTVKLRDAMTTLRNGLRDKTTLPVFASAYSFIFIEQFVLTLPETVKNLSLAATAILIVTSLFLINPLVILLVVLEFVSLIFELFGLMYVWGVSLNSVSMINLVVAIGFAVDYSAHLAHAFVFSSQTTPEEKAVDALRTVGASVMMGGFSTFLGIVVMALASSDVFRIFFKMFFGIVVIGLLHGLCFLPVWMSIVCRCDLAVTPAEKKLMKRNTDELSVTKEANFVTGRDNALSIQNHSLSNCNEKPDSYDVIGNEDHTNSSINPALLISNEELRRHVMNSADIIDSADVINNKDHAHSSINLALCSVFSDDSVTMLSLNCSLEMQNNVAEARSSRENSQLRSSNADTHDTKI